MGLRGWPPALPPGPPPPVPRGRVLPRGRPLRRAGARPGAIKRRPPVPRALGPPPRPALSAGRPCGSGRPWPAPCGAWPRCGPPRVPLPRPGRKGRAPLRPPKSGGLALGPPARGRCGARGGPKGGPPWAHSRPRPAPGRGAAFLLVLRSFRQLSTNRCIRVSGPAARPEAPLARLFMAAAGSAISSPGSRSASKCGEYPGLSVRVGLTRQPGCDTLE